MSSMTPPPTNGQTHPKPNVDTSNRSTPTPSGSGTAPSGGPSARVLAIKACDRCRKHKARCIPSEGDSCRRCEEAGVPCVFIQASLPAQPSSSERIAKLEAALQQTQSRLFNVEEALTRVGVAVESSILSSESQDRLPILASLSAEALDNPSRPSYLDGQVRPVTLHVEESSRLMKMVDQIEDVTSADVIRIGREEHADLLHRPIKRQRVLASSTDYPTEVSEQLAFDIFSKQCCVFIPFLDPDSSDYTPAKYRKRSLLLYWSIVAVGSREEEELVATYALARRKAIELSQSTFGGKLLSPDDLMGLCIVQNWLTPIRSPGHTVGLAYELNLHSITTDSQPRAAISPIVIEQARLWCWIAITDHYCSIATGKPHLVCQDDTWHSCQRFLQANACRPRDTRLRAQIDLMAIISQAQQGLVSEVPYLVSRNYQALRERNDAIDAWLSQWRAWGACAKDERRPFSQYDSLLLQYAFAKLHVNCLALRGVRQAADLSSDQLVFAHVAVTHARELLRLSVEKFQPPLICYKATFTHIQITWSAVVLLKIIRLLPASFDVASIFQQIQEVIALLGHVRDKFHRDSLLLMSSHVASQLQMQPILEDASRRSMIHLPSILSEEGGVADSNHWNLPGGWNDELTSGNLWGWDASSLIDGLGNGGLYV